MSLRLTDLRLARPLLPRTPHTYRVMFMGDSAGMPQGVTAEQGTAFLLEQAMNRMLPWRNVEVLNRSTGGMSFHHYALMTEQMLGDVQPDLIVYFVCSNDSEIHGLPLDVALEQTARQQWGEGSPLVAHLKASAKRAAAAAGDVPVVLFGINYIDMPGAAEMDGVLRGIAGELGWKYATTRGRLDTLPMERLVATDTDHHPSPYVHQLAVNEICLVLTRDLRIHTQKTEPNVPALVDELTGRLAALPVQSAEFRAELLRMLDLFTQKVVHLRKSPRADALANELGQMEAARTRLLAVLNRQDEVLAGVVRQRQHETALLVPEEFPLQMFQRIKLLGARVHDTVSRHLEGDGSLPYAEAGDEPPAGNEANLLTQAEAAANQLRGLAAQLVPFTTNRDTPGGAPADAIAALLSRVQAAGREALFRAETRQDDVVSLVREAADYAAELVARARPAIAAGGDRRRAAARSLFQLLGTLQIFQGAYFQVPQTRAKADAAPFWQPQEWEGAESAPMWTLTIDIASDRANAVGLWVDSVTPHGFFADYQQTGPSLTTYTFTFPHTREFHLKLAASAPFTPAKAKLSCGAVTVENINWVQRQPHFWRLNEVLKVAA